VDTLGFIILWFASVCQQAGVNVVWRGPVAGSKPAWNDYNNGENLTGNRWQELRMGRPRGRTCDYSTLDDPRWRRYVELHKKYLYMSTGRFDFRTTALAAALGLNRRTIQRWMRGVGAPDHKQLQKIENFVRSREKGTV
jgi:hypothetical protein